MRKMLILLLGIAAFFGGIQGLHIKAFETTAFADKKIVFFGDSITAGTSVTNVEDRFANIVASELGFESFVNNGSSGSRITKQTGITNSLVERYSDLAADADYVVVFAGINDYWTGTGVFGEPTSTTDTEFYGALNTVFAGLKAKYTTGEIIIVTPFKSYVGGSSGSVVANSSSGKKLTQYNTAIIDRAKAHNLTYIDMHTHIGFDADLNTDDRAKYTTDGVHLSVDGHRRVANILISYFQKTTFTAYKESIFTSIDSEPGTLTSAGSTEYNHTAFISVEAGKSYFIFSENTGTTGSGITSVGKVYNSEETEIASILFGVGLAPWVTVYKMPENAAFIKINYVLAKESNVYINEMYNYSIYVDFETNGGTTIEPIEVNMHDKLVVSSPTKTGYNFVGWYKDASLTQPFSIVIDTIIEDTTLYAKWTPATSTGGGSIIIDNAGNFTNIDYIIMGGAALLLIVIFGSKKKKGKWS